MRKVLFLLLFGGFMFADPIKIAMDNEYPPFEWSDKGGKIVGFDVDFAAELSKRVGFEYQIVQAKYDSICEMINSKKADIGISAFGDDDESKDCEHGISYFESEYLFIKDISRKDINSITDLEGKKVAYDNSTMVGLLKEINAKPVKRKTGTLMSTLLLLHEGKVDSVLIDSCGAPVLQGRTEFLPSSDIAKLDLVAGGLSNFAIFHEQPGDDSETFIIYPKDGRLESLKNQIDNAIIQMRKDGSIKALMDKYGLK